MKPQIGFGERIVFVSGEAKGVLMEGLAGVGTWRSF